MEKIKHTTKYIQNIIDRIIYNLTHDNILIEFCWNESDLENRYRIDVNFNNFLHLHPVSVNVLSGEMKHGQFKGLTVEQICNEYLYLFRYLDDKLYFVQTEPFITEPFIVVENLEDCR